MVRWLSYIISILLVLSPYTTAKPFKYLSYADIHLRLSELASAHPTLIRLYSAQQTFLLPHVGNCTQFDTTNPSQPPSPAPCTIWVVELSNFQTLQNDSTRPELLISGLLHGDEVIGPHAVLAYIEHMLENYASDPFVKRMLDTRYVTLVPMTNAVGFHRNERGERQPRLDGTGDDVVDPNRDFGFDQQPSRCMQTVAARAINELFRAHLFRLLVTFHGGTNVVGYEWGDLTHCNGPDCSAAPDMKIMHALGNRMSDVAGPAGTFESAYPVGDMGGLVYPVNGGMEDWAYGASWAGQGVECRPETLGGYSKEKVKIDSGAQRCVTYLVETAKSKKPDEASLGKSEHIMLKGAAGDGHVPRNVRLILTVVDAVEPYVDLKPELGVTEDSRLPVVRWMVGGAFLVDGTVLQWSTRYGTHYGQGKVLNGTVVPVGNSRNAATFSHTFRGNFPSESVPIYIRAIALVDQLYSTQPDGSVPNVSPQSHLMGSRASNNWNFSVGERTIRGRNIFSSATFKLSKTSAGSFHLAEERDAHWGFGEERLFSQTDRDLLVLLSSGDMKGGILPTSSGMSIPLTILTAVAGVLLIVAIAVAIFIFARKRRFASRRGHRAKNSFALTHDEEEEQRLALTPIDDEDRIEEGVTDEVLAASGLRGTQGAGI